MSNKNQSKSRMETRSGKYLDKLQTDELTGVRGGETLDELQGGENLDELKQEGPTSCTRSPPHQVMVGERFSQDH
ncbi:hypothetical protein scyTo_0000681 [Scyliorhinus torazame]|uniref:Uncharacterized protein n=1 Tax=Scyliorhinus torazame TaxID=75743 RepID=A0A401P1W7_SCYTO|nr:hypothetical protein [Scyliorhinus torazame]